MKISTKGRYALRTMVDLAQYGTEGLVTLKDIASRQDLSQKYLEQIVTALSRAGFVKGIRGPQGGYRLALEPRECTVADILKVVEGNLAPVECLEETPNQCDRCGMCPTIEMWDGLYRVITDYLQGITLQNLLDKAMQNVGNDYVI